MTKNQDYEKVKDVIDEANIGAKFHVGGRIKLREIKLLKDLVSQISVIHRVAGEILMKFDELFSNLFSKTIAFTKFLSK